MLPANAYNCSLIRFQGRLLLSYRWHSKKDWRTELGIAELNDRYEPISSKAILPPKDLQDNSMEDLRFCIHQGTLMASWTISQYPATVFRSIVAVGYLVEKETHWEISRFIIPDFGQNDFTSVQKNWIFWEHASKLYCLYLTHENQQTILEFDETFRVEQVLKSKALPWPKAPIHGGAICEGANGNRYHFFNSHTTHKERQLDRYFIGCAELSGQPPFDMLRISSRPIISGEEGYDLHKNPHFKPNVAFVAGAIRDGDSWLISYGWNDSQCRLIRLHERDLKL